MWAAADLGAWSRTINITRWWWWRNSYIQCKRFDSKFEFSSVQIDKCPNWSIIPPHKIGIKVNWVKVKTVRVILHLSYDKFFKRVDWLENRKVL